METDFKFRINKAKEARAKHSRKLGKAFRRAREAKGMSLRKFAAVAGISPMQQSMLERGTRNWKNQAEVDRAYELLNAGGAK